jgi:hypothetical protein
LGRVVEHRNSVTQNLVKNILGSLLLAVGFVGRGYCEETPNCEQLSGAI